MSRRDLQAAETRRAILVAARKLFAQQGYARTTIAEIARAAGVSPQTIYDSVGSKAEVVRQINDLIDELAGIGQLVGAAMQSNDPAKLLELPLEISYQILATSGDIVRTGLDAAYSEPEIAALAEDGTRRHQAGAQRLAGQLARLGALPPGMTPEAAAEILAVHCDTTWWVMLQKRYGWSLDQTRDWAKAAIERAGLVAPSKASPET